MRRFVSVDIETGGLDPRTHPITEVGMVFETEEGPQEVEFSLPFDPDACDPVALKVQRYGEREYAPQWTHIDAARFIAATTDDVHLVGKNPWFDEGFLRVLLLDWGFEPKWHHRLVDVGCLVWGWHNGKEDEREEETGGASFRELQPPNSGRVGELIKKPIEEVEQHAALYDARWAYNAFRVVVPLG